MFSHPIYILGFQGKDKSMINSQEKPFDHMQVIAAATSIIENLKNYNFFNPRVFLIYGKRPEEVKDAFYKEGLSFLELKTKNNIIIEQSLYDKCKEVAASVYEKQMCFLQEYDKGELEDMIKIHPAIKDRSFLQIGNLTKIELNTFLECCNNIKKGLLIETYEQNPGAYTVRFPNAMLSKEEKQKIVDAYIESSIKSFGVHFDNRNADKYTAEMYTNALKEQYFIKLATVAIKEKLLNENYVEMSFEDYFKSAGRQTAYILRQLREGKEAEGFPLQLQNALKDVFKDLPEDTYKYSAEKILSHEITLKNEHEIRKTAAMEVTKIMQQEK